jgi:hypothetical protein
VNAVRAGALAAAAAASLLLTACGGGTTSSAPAASKKYQKAAFEAAARTCGLEFGLGPPRASVSHSKAS